MNTEQQITDKCLTKYLTKELEKSAIKDFLRKKDPLSSCVHPYIQWWEQRWLRFDRITRVIGRKSVRENINSSM